MTALAGVWTWGGSPEPAAACSRMLDGQRSFGGRAATWSGRGVALARSLMPLLAEDAFDTGPAIGAGGALVLVADVRLDNRADLARALGLDEHEHARLSDAELLLRCWERWDEEALQHLVGDYALALWDDRDRRLVLARDFLGRRPLHFHQGERFFAFASMPKGLHALAQVPYRLSEERAIDFLGQMHNSGPASFFEGVDRVEPGEIVTVRQGSVARRKYWSPDLSPLDLPRAEDYAELLREKLDEAVAARLRGCGGRVASHLSAGLDSASVTATAARLLAERGGRVVAFTSVPKPGYEARVPRGRLADEGPIAASVARMYANIEHVPFIVPDDASPLAALDRHFFLYDRPLLNICNAIWIDAINDEAKRRGLRVMLTGEVGNVSMSYDGEHLLTELLLRGRFVGLARQAAALMRRGQRARTVAVAALGPFFPAWLSRRLEAFRETPGLLRNSAIRRSVARGGAFRERARDRGVEEHFRNASTSVAARLKRFATLDSGNINKGTLAGWGIDIRDPTADRRIVELCLRIPTGQFARSGQPRSLARDAFADRLPTELLAEPKRGYQFADWPRSLAGSREEAEALIGRLEAHPFAREALDVDRLRDLVSEWPDEAEMAVRRVDYRQALLRAASLGRFVEKATGSN